MSKHSTPLRPAMTAIAAVIALSSTPLLAQATTDTAPAAPVVAAPPVTDGSAPPAVAQTAPEAAAAPVAAAPVEAAAAPAPAMRTMSTPVEHTGPEASDEPPVRTATVTRTAIRSAPAKTAAPAAAKPAPASVERTSEPAPAAPVSAAPAPVETASAPAPVATTTRSTTHQSLDSDALPMAGIVGLGVIAIGGAAFALRRKRREDEEDELLLDRDSSVVAAPVARAPVAEAAVPIAARTASDRAAAASAARTLPNGFDLSRFGRHTQAAYRGPTPDNPSHSLKRRLKHASFFDQREREAAAAGSPRDLAGPAYPVQAARANQDNGQVTIRMAPQRNPGSFGYVLQK